MYVCFVNCEWNIGTNLSSEKAHVGEKGFRYSETVILTKLKKFYFNFNSYLKKKKIAGNKSVTKIQ